jgi:hypothetical protein
MPSPKIRNANVEFPERGDDVVLTHRVAAAADAARIAGLSVAHDISEGKH